MDISDPIFGLVLKAVLLTLFFGIYAFREKIEWMIQKTSSNTVLIALFKSLVRSCRIRYNHWTTSLLVPIVLISAPWIYLFRVGANINPLDQSVVNIIQATLLTPIFEEIFFRGIILGLTIALFTFLTSRYLEWKSSTISAINIYVLSIFLTSLAFSFLHEFKIDLRYIGGIIFSIAYVADRRNLLPAIIAHALNNAAVFYFVR